MDIEQASYAFSQFTIAVFTLASGSEDLEVRLRSAHDQLRSNITEDDLPDDLRDPYAGIMSADPDTLSDRERVSLSGKIISFAFALLEIVSKWEMTKGSEAPSRDSLLSERLMSLDGGTPSPG